jgi:hypothetical protein
MSCGRITINIQFVVAFDFVFELLSLGNVMCFFLFYSMIFINHHTSLLGGTYVRDKFCAAQVSSGCHA